VTGSGHPRAGLAHPPDRGHRQVPGGQRRGDVPRWGTLRCRTRAIPDGEADRAAGQQRDQDRDNGGVQRRQLHDRIHADRQPQRIPPGRPPGQPDHGGVGDQASQVGVKGVDVADTGARHDDRVIEPGGGRARQQDVGDLGRSAGQQAGRHRLGEMANLTPDELGDSQPHGQNQQREQRNRGGNDEQGVRQPPARAHDVGLHPRRGRGRRDGGHRQHEYPNAGHDAAQPVNRLADPALQLISDLDRARLRHETIVSPARPVA